MEYDPAKRIIKLNKELSALDEFVLKFIVVLKKHVGYVIVSGYVSILLGRARATEDVDVFIRPMSMDGFSSLYDELKTQGFWCLNAEEADEIFSYLEDGLAVRFSEKGKIIPNFEVKFTKKRVDEAVFEDSLKIIMPKCELVISSLERQIAFKRFYLKSNKDIDDALYIEELFKEQLDYNKVNKLRNIIDK